MSDSRRKKQENNKKKYKNKEEHQQEPQPHLSVRHPLPLSFALLPLLETTNTCGIGSRCLGSEKTTYSSRRKCSYRRERAKAGKQGVENFTPRFQHAQPPPRSAQRPPMILQFNSSQPKSVRQRARTRQPAASPGASTQKSRSSRQYVLMVH